MSFEEIYEKAMREWEKFNALERPRILLGAATCGRASGINKIRESLKAELAAKSIQADICEVGCLGMCYAEPMLEIGLPDGRRILYKDVTPALVPALVEEVISRGNPLAESALCTFGDRRVEGIPDFRELPMIKPQVRVVLRNSGRTDPTNIYHYIANGGYSGLKNAIAMGREATIEEIKKSGLRGRGGAGFPTGVKWGFAYKEKNEHKYMICNADEGDPGAFMDRAAIEGDPHAVLEGLAIGAYAIGADFAYIYCRAEYPLAIERLENAIAQMHELGFAGKNVMGSDFSLEFKVKKGAGAFVCGEETALIASIEGNYGRPKTRPPFPAQKGLWGKPTIINNVETLANVSEIMNRGAGWFSGYGTEKSKGAKTFALAGKINRTGLIEVPMGITLREIIYDIGGGILNGKQFKAIQTGGPSGGSIPAEHLDLHVDYDELAKIGSIMGSGGMIVMDEDNCMVDVARYFLDFTQKESCGKCTPCRMGTKMMLEILENLCQGRGKTGDIETLLDLAANIKQGSLCGLGQTAPNPVLTTVRYFRSEYEAHVNDKQCPSLNCKVLLRYAVNQETCKLCGNCKRSCPAEAITGDKKKEIPFEIHVEKCIQCGMCYTVCPFDSVVKTSPGLAPKKEEEPAAAGVE